MNWIIRHSKKLRFHTDIFEIMKPIENQTKDFHWLISDLDFIADEGAALPINFEQDYFVLTSKEFEKLVSEKIQIIWGAVLGFPNEVKLEIDSHTLPFVEGNDKIWKPGNIQHADAEVEIDCFDSGYTIAKFTNEDLSNSFKQYFPEAIALEKWK